MINYYERARTNKEIFRQLYCKDLLFVYYDSPLGNKLQERWSQHNYILYVVTGQKVLYSTTSSWTLTGDMSVFVKKGACIAEKISDEVLCLMAFFIPDSYLRTFLCENNNLLIRGKNNGFETVDGIYSRSNDKNPSVSHQNEIVIPLEINALMHAYFESLKPYFFSSVKPHEDLLDLKFRELLFNLIGNPANEQFNNFLETLISSQWNNIRPVIEANYCFNLKLNEYARLCNRSLSSFKRDFYQLYGQPPAKWLLNKRLSRSRELLFNSSYPIDDISFESGFKNSTHFSHAFKKYFGISPLKYRQKIEITKHSF